MKRIAQVIGLPPDNARLYEEVHREVWPGVLAQLHASHIQNYSIYRYGDLLFSYFEYVGEDFDSDMETIASHSTTREWWAVCGPLQRPVPERRPGEWWHDLHEVFHVD